MSTVREELLNKLNQEVEIGILVLEEIRDLLEESIIDPTKSIPIEVLKKSIIVVNKSVDVQLTNVGIELMDIVNENK
jgi:hypothetical protein